MLQERLAELGLQTKAAKTRIVHLQEAGEGLDFLGFHLRMVRARSPRHRHVVFLARWPSRKAMQHARDRVRFLTARARLAAPTEQVVAEVNRFLRGWAGYFRFGHSAHDLDRIRSFAVRRLAHYVGYRHKRGFRGGWHRVVYASPDCMGIISLNRDTPMRFSPADLGTRLMVVSVVTGALAGGDYADGDYGSFWG